MEDYYLYETRPDCHQLVPIRVIVIIIATYCITQTITLTTKHPRVIYRVYLVPPLEFIQARRIVVLLLCKSRYY